MSTVKSKIIVTGGAGFIGSHTVVALYEAGYLPVIIDNFSNSNPNVLKGIEKIIGVQVPFYEIDCNDKIALDNIFETEKNIAGVIHFAAYKAVGESVNEPLKYYYNNVHSLVTLIEVMNKHKVLNLVFSSSCTVYGTPEHIPVDENTPTQRGVSPYGNTKKVCEEILEDVLNSGLALKSIALRYFNPIGAHPSALIGELPNGVPNNLVPFITQTAAKIREKITVFGTDYDTEDGSCLRDYIHVVDLANAHIKALEYLFKQNDSSFYDKINIGTGIGESVINVIKSFEEATGVKVNYELGPRRAGDVPKIYSNATKANNLLNWEAKYTLKEALKHAWTWQQTL